MKNLEIFLKHPNLFFSRIAPSQCTIGLSPVNLFGTPFFINGENKLPAGVLLSWGAPGPRNNSSGYYYRTALPDAAKRSIKTQSMRYIKKTSTEETITHDLEIGSQHSVRNLGNNNNYSSDTGKRSFSKIVLTDAKNQAYTDSIPGLIEKFAAFAKETHGWWLPTAEQPANNRHRNSNEVNTPHLVDVTDLITSEVADDASEALDATIDLLVEEELREWEVTTHRTLGINDQPSTPHVYRPRKEGDPAQVPGDGSADIVPVSQTGALKIRTWEAKERGKIGNLPTKAATSSGHKHMSNFNIKLLEQKHNVEQYRIYAVFDWTRVRYTHECKMIKRPRNRYTPPGVSSGDKVRSSTDYTLYLPRITGLVVEMIPKEAEVGYITQTPNTWGSMDSARSSQYALKTLTRVADRTKKRSVKGGYRGGYQGIEKLKYNEKVLVEHIMVSGLQQFAKGAPIRSFEKREQKRIPLSLKRYNKIERPEVEIKPLEIAHLRFYRLSNPPKRQVSADILSDLLLPSMPALLIATDSDIRVTSGDEYINGENCSGNCVKGEVEITIPPGLYLVDRQEKCALGHDPGRKEYTAGFGDTCNEIITIRRMLSQLNVFYDEFRGNMVGSTNRNTLNTMNATDNSAFLGRLG